MHQAHPNVRLFISQCGLQSFQEAVFHAVPVLGIPFIADQKFNAKKIQDSGIGVKLSFVDVTKESLTQSINEILHNVRFKDPPGTPYPSSPYHFHRDNVTRLPGVPTSEMGYNTATPGVDKTTWWH
ncbi:hypothetical protein C0J52_18330 [Blattella germanica]|nr:hypothetical protein C0J52_18330 [Blattella germanica]